MTEPVRTIEKIGRIVQIDQHSFNVRSLTRGEIKKLKAGGLNLAALTPQTADDAIDATFEIIFTPREVEIIDGIENKKVLKLWSAVLAETYGSEDEEKTN